MRLTVVGSGELGSRLALRALGSGATVTGAGAARAPERWPESAPWNQATGEDLAAMLGDSDAVALLPGDGPGSAARTREALDVLVGGQERRSRLVYWGSHRVYAPPADRQRPCGETAALVEGGVYGEWAELDRRVRALAQNRSGLEVVQLRAVPVLGHGMDGWVRRLRGLPLVVVPRETDPVQVLHADDAVDVLWRGCTVGHPGVYNTASDGLLFRSRVARALGRVPLPMPRGVAAILLAPGRLLGRPARLREALAEAYEPLVLDNGRLKTHFGYRPRRTASSALLEAVRPAGSPPPSAGSL